MKIKPPIFFSEKGTATTMKFTWMIHISFMIMMLFFHKVSIIFNTFLPVLIKTLYTTVVKFPASTSENSSSGMNLAGTHFILRPLVKMV
jgi:hypothetical protein